MWFEDELLKSVDKFDFLYNQWDMYIISTQTSYEVLDKKLATVLPECRNIKIEMFMVSYLYLPYCTAFIL